MSARTAAPAPAPPRTAPSHAPLPIALDVDVYGKDGGKAVAHVERGEVAARSDQLTRMAVVSRDGIAEIVEGQRVRIRTGAGEIDGWVELPKHVTRRGVGFFATTSSDVVDERGRLVGRVAPGAFLPLVRIEVDVARVMLVPFGVEGFVPLAVLATRARPVVVERDHAPAIENRRIALVTASGLTSTVCGDAVQIGATEGDGVRVRQTVDGITITGIARSDAARCPTRVAWAGDVPTGWVRPASGATSVFAKSRDFFRIQSAGGPSCTRWRYRAGAKPTLTHTATGEMLDGQVTWTSVYDVEGAKSQLPLPAWISTAHVESHERIDHVVVGESPAGVAVLENVPSRDDHTRASEAMPIAFHPADASTWFVSQDECERALSRFRGDLRSRLLAGYAE